MLKLVGESYETNRKFTVSKALSIRYLSTKGKIITLQWRNQVVKIPLSARD